VPCDSALAQLDVLATTEIIENETTALSTHVLPTKDQLERADINLWDFLSPRVAGMYSPAVVSPAGGARSPGGCSPNWAGASVHDAADPGQRRSGKTIEVMLRQTARARASSPTSPPAGTWRQTHESPRNGR